MSSLGRRIFFVFLLNLVGVPSAWTFSLDPTVTVLTLPGDGAGKTVLLRNPRNVDLPVSFSIFERAIKADGAEDHVPAEQEFVIFPPQVVVPAGGSQAVRVQWVGRPLEQSRSFTLYAEELPINLSANPESGVNTLLRIGASIHVTAAEFSPEPKIVEYNADSNGVVLSIENNGSEYLYINDLAIEFEETVIEGVALANAAGRTLIPPGSMRSFTVTGVKGAPSLVRRTRY